MHRTLALALLIVGACKAEDRRPGAPQDLTPPMLAHGTQQDLVKELDAADAHGSWAEVKRRWQGQTLRWTVMRPKALCRTEELCNVAAFPIQRPAKHGWLPQLVFAPGQYAALDAACGDKTECEVTIEGTLERLEVSGELPTSLKFANVKLVTKTASR